MNDIDAEKLEEAIDRMARYFGNALGHSDLLVLDAARAHLATLTRYKEVEVEAFAVVDSDGEAVEIWLLEENARLDVEDIDGAQVVRLTGTAKVKVTP